jgi:uncharacterized membrane protein HdeD (DUF308 family)
MAAQVYTSTQAPLATNWWALALRGAIAVLFGIVTLLVPGLTLVYLMYLFGLFAVLDGVLAIMGAVRAHEGHERWGALLILGIGAIAVGILTFLYPGLTALTLLYFIAGWAIWSGVFHIVAAIRLRKHITGEWLLILGGVLSVLFGLFLVLAPGAGALAFVLWIGAFAIVSGAVLIGLAFRLRSLVTAGFSGAPSHA